ncbi:MAG: NACHT domain-containing protein, partial [Gammaproteobacteria bacterium]
EICFDKIFNQSNLYIKEIQKQLADLRAELKQPDLSKEDKLDCYQKIESSLEKLKNYYVDKQAKSHSRNSREQYSTNSTSVDKNIVFAFGYKARAEIIHNHITQGKSILEKIEKYLTSLFIKTQLITSNKDFRSLAQQIYVEPESSWSGETRSSLKERCDAFIKQPEQKVFVILGDPGVGKTTFGLRYIQNCWGNFQEKNKTNTEEIVCNEPLPLFIRLNEILKDGKIISDLLESFLKDKVGLTIDQINELKTKPLVAFLDGYDEISDRGNIYHENRWKDNWPNLKCIISTRPEKFGSFISRSELQDDLLRAFAPDITGRNAAIPACVMISQLLEFSSTQVNMFISQWHGLTQLQDWTQGRYEQSIQTIPGLSDLTSNPVILSLVLFASPEIEKKHRQQEGDLHKKQLQRIDVYDEFVNSWFEDQAERLLNNLNHTTKVPGLREKLDELGDKFNCIESLRLYSSQLAYWTVVNQQGGKLNLDIPNEETLQEYLLEDPTGRINFFISELKPEEIEALLIALRSGCLLNCEDGYFRFLHKSLVEYFAQEHIFKGVLGLLSLAANGETLNYALAEPNLLHMIAERVKEEPALKAALYQLIQDSREQPELAYAAANALTIWHYAGEVIATLPLQGVRVPGADLSGASLHLADCRDADFSGVNFRGVYFVSANFENAILANCKWDNPTEIRFEYSIVALGYSLDGKLLIVGDAGNNIHFLQTDTYFVEKTYKLDSRKSKYSYSVTCLAIDSC